MPYFNARTDEAMTPVMKYFAEVLGLLALVIFVPVVPLDTAALGDPTSHNDPRVTAELTDEDLAGILYVTRRGNFNSLFEILWYDTREPLLTLSKSKETTVYSTHEKSKGKRMPAIGQFEVRIGHVCGPLCGSGGIVYVENKNGIWRVVEHHQWVS